MTKINLLRCKAVIWLDQGRPGWIRHVSQPLAPDLRIAPPVTMRQITANQQPATLPLDALRTCAAFQHLFCLIFGGGFWVRKITT